MLVPRQPTPAGGPSPEPGIRPTAGPRTAPAPTAVDAEPDAVGENTTFHQTATDRQRFQVHLDFGRVFETQGNFDRGDPGVPGCLDGRRDQAAREFQADDRALAHRRMAAALDRLGRFPQAEDHYKKAMKLGPKDPKIWNDAGYSYYLQGRWGEAERALRTALKLAPDDARVRTNLGLTLAAAGRSQEALPLLSRSDGDAIGHANLGYLLAATGQFDLARREYQKALAMRPDLELPRRALAQLDRQQQAVQGTGTKNLMARAPSPPVPADPHVMRASATASERRRIPPPRRLDLSGQGTGTPGTDPATRSGRSPATRVPPRPP